jgi:hypothetical protein
MSHRDLGRGSSVEIGSASLGGKCAAIVFQRGILDSVAVENLLEHATFSPMFQVVSRV